MFSLLASTNSFKVAGTFSKESIVAPFSDVCLKLVKFQRLIFVLSGLGNSRLFAKSKPSKRISFIHVGSLCSAEKSATYFSSNGNFVTVVIALPLLTSNLTIMLFVRLFRLQ